MFHRSNTVFEKRFSARVCCENMIRMMSKRDSKSRLSGWCLHLSLLVRLSSHRLKYSCKGQGCFAPARWPVMFPLPSSKLCIFSCSFSLMIAWKGGCEVLSCVWVFACLRQEFSSLRFYVTEWVSNVCFTSCMNSHGVLVYNCCEDGVTLGPSLIITNYDFFQNYRASILTKSVREGNHFLVVVVMYVLSPVLNQNCLPTRLDWAKVS